MGLRESFLHDEKGGVAIMFALLLVPLLGVAGLALDYTRASSERVVLQNEIDAAVLAGATAGSRETAERLFTSLHGGPLLAANFSLKDNVLKGAATIEVDTVLLRIFAIPTIEVGVAAAAEIGAGDPVCILVKSPNASQALLVNSGVKISAPKCQMHVRSAVAGGAMINNGGNIDMSRVCFKSPNFTENGSVIPRREKNCDAIDDPYAGKLPVTTAKSSWDYPNDTNFNSGTVTIPVAGKSYRKINSGASTLNMKPGTYGDINFNGSPTVNFEPGVYVVTGTWNMNGGRYAGTDVTFYFASNNAKFQVNSSSRMQLSAPTSGDYANILIYEAHTNANGQSIAWNGNADQKLNGLIYLPSRQLTFNSTSKISSDRISLVVDRLTLNNIDWTFSPLSGRTMSSGGSGTNTARLIN